MSIAQNDGTESQVTDELIITCATKNEETMLNSEEKNPKNSSRFYL